MITVVIKVFHCRKIRTFFFTFCWWRLGGFRFAQTVPYRSSMSYDDCGSFPWSQGRSAAARTLPGRPRDPPARPQLPVVKDTEDNTRITRDDRDRRPQAKMFACGRRSGPSRIILFSVSLRWSRSSIVRPAGHVGAPTDLVALRAGFDETSKKMFPRRFPRFKVAQRRCRPARSLGTLVVMTQSIDSSLSSA